MSLNTSTQGIFQTDLIIRTAIIQGLREIRKNPELLDYAFASLPQDELTAKTYGQKNIDAAKEWFLGLGTAGGTDFPVRLNVTIQKATLPCISIEIREAQETEATLADIHYDPSETYEIPWPAITPAFAATSYNADTGAVGLPKSITDATMVFPGMVIVDRAGNPHTIISAIDDSTVEIAPAVADFTFCVLKYRKPATGASLESVRFRTTVAIGVHVQGDAEKTIWLTSIILFILLRYRQNYFEARGFEQSSVTVGTLGMDTQWSEGEIVYSQTLQLSGFYRNYWPKFIGSTIQGILPATQLNGVGPSPAEMDVSDNMWNEEGDVLAGIQPYGIKGSTE